MVGRCVTHFADMDHSIGVEEERLSIFNEGMVIWVLFHDVYNRGSDIIITQTEMVMEMEKREGPAEGVI